MLEPIQAADGCIEAHALDDLALIAAIDGEAEPAVVEHLRICGYCAARAQHYAELQGLLRRQFFRMFCPSGDTLIAFYEGTLAAAQHCHLQAHLAECPHCARELRFLGQLNADAINGRSPPASWFTINAPTIREPFVSATAQLTQPLKHIIATRTMAQSSSSVSDFYGAARAHMPISQYAYQAENLQITLGVRPVAQRTDRHVVIGSLTLSDAPDINLNNAVAYLSRQQQTISVVEIDELGRFVLDNLLPGIYQLAFRLPDREVIIEEVNL
ncbi:MAG: hypothetical protein IPP13_18085 [Kouleothrix sp.]|jgi:anti-sigma factor RsiW|nr:hypothetical protein [Kouleothrix sp.]